MRLKYLRIGTEWASPTDPLKGEVLFQGETGKISLNLDAEACQRVLEVLAEELVRHGKEIAQRLTTEVIESSAIPRQLES